MLSTNSAYLNMNDSLARRIKGKVEHYSGSTLLGTYKYDDALQNIHVDRTAASGKFFGFGVAQKLTLKLADSNNTINVYEGNTFKLYFNVNDSAYLRVGPTFTVDSVKRDEKTNGLTITALDPIGSKLSKFTYDIIDTKTTQTVEYILSRIASLLGLNLSANYSSWGSLATLTGIPNYDGTETLREVLDDIAEAVQAIYFCDGSTLYMKELRPSDKVALTIKKSDYYELTTAELQVLGGIAHVTELGDNLEVGSGTIQVVRDNAFWEKYGDISDLLEESQLRVRLLTITPFNCSWRGNFALQIGDKIAITDKTGSVVNTYVLNDSFEYNGGFKQTSSWAYEAEKVESTNPVTIGEKINHTSAKVDKVKQEITLLAADTQTKIEQSVIDSKDYADDKDAENKQELQDYIDGQITTVTETITSKESELRVDLDSITQRVEATETVTQTISSGVDSIESTVAQHTSQIGTLQVNANQIFASVESLEQKTTSDINSVNATMESLTQRVNASMTSEQVKFEIQSELNDGVSKVSTSTGVIVDELGVRVEKTNAQTHTQITENGMEVIRTQGNQPLLTANKDGVQAEDLEATTYLLVGGSRFESYGSDRTGCFWIGGN